MNWSEIFRYEEETGKLLWRYSKGGWVKAGVEAGGVNPSTGYRRVKVDGRLWSVHRIILDMHNPNDLLSPEDEIDHINHKRDDNRLRNLRKVSCAENMRNKSINSNNSSGYPDIYFDKKRDKWQVRITVNWKRKHIGYFSDINAAVAARKAAEVEYGFHDNHGKDILCD